MLVEEGFEVVSVDASDKMLKYALKERWNRRKEPGFDSWSKHHFSNCFFFCHLSSPFCKLMTINGFSFSNLSIQIAIEEANWL